MCVDKRTTDQFIDVTKKYLGSNSGSKANASLKDPSYAFPIVHWACALGKHEALRRLSKMEAFNMATKACTGEIGLHRAVRCLYRGMGEPTKVSKIKEVTQIFSKILDILTSSSRDIFIEADDHGDTVLHANARELYQCKEKFPNKFRFLEECMEKLLKKLASWKKSEVHADLAASVLSFTNDREQNFVHILVRVPEFRSNSVVKLLNMVDVDILRKLFNMQDCIDETPKETAERKNRFRVVKFIDDVMPNTEDIASPSPDNQHIPSEHSDKEPDVISESGSRPDPVSLMEGTEYSSSCEKSDQDSASEDDKRDTIAISAGPRAQQVAELDIGDPPLQNPKMTFVDFVAQLSSSPNFSDTASPSERTTNQDYNEDQVDSTEVMRNNQLELIEDDHKNNCSSNESDAAGTTASVDLDGSPSIAVRSDYSDYCTSQNLSNSFSSLNSEEKLTEDHSCYTRSFFSEEARGQPVSSSDQTISAPFNRNSRDTLRTPGSRLKRKLEMLIDEAVEKDKTYQMLEEKKHRLDDDLRREENKQQELEARIVELKKQQKELELEMERSRTRFKSLKENRKSLEIEIKNVNDWCEQHNKKFCRDQDI